MKNRLPVNAIPFEIDGKPFYAKLYNYGHKQVDGRPLNEIYNDIIFENAELKEQVEKLKNQVDVQTELKVKYQIEAEVKNARVGELTNNNGNLKDLLHSSTRKVEGLRRIVVGLSIAVAVLACALTM